MPIENEKRTTSSSRSEKQLVSSSSSTTTVQLFQDITRPRAVEVLRRYQMEEIKRLHREVLGRPMPAPISAAVLRDLDADTPSAYYKYALTETMYAPKPSWRYVQAIVNRCKSQLIDPAELEY